MDRGDHARNAPSLSKKHKEAASSLAWQVPGPEPGVGLGEVRGLAPERLGPARAGGGGHPTHLGGYYQNQLKSSKIY